MGEGMSVPRLGKYELRGELGRGAMGVVYRAFDRVLCRDVALKTMTAPSSDRTQTARFLREARTAGGLHHPNIVTIHELGQDSGTYYIAMELLEGRDLRELMASGQTPPLDRRLQIIARVCDGLDYAHRAGIVHRDIKPANVFLTASGTVKILDFGIAKINSSDATRTGVVIGTVDYMSPEQVRAIKALDGRSDVFSAGVILYELLFGRRPFTAEDLGATLHRILHRQPPGYALFDRILPAGLAQVLRRSLDKRCEARYPRAGEMAEALDRAGSELSGRAGTELEERIAELIASGVLERNDEGPAIASTSAEGPAHRAPARTPDRATRAPRAQSKRSRLAVATVVAALTVLAVVGVLGLRRGEREATPPAVTTIAEPAPVPTESVEPLPDPGTDAAPATAPTPEPAVEEPAAETPVVAAAPPPPGLLDVRVMPWANIEWIENVATGERVPSDRAAPVRLRLPAGRYRLRVVNPYSERSVDLDATVAAGETRVVRHTMPGFDAAQLAGDILRRSAGAEGS